MEVNKKSNRKRYLSDFQYDTKNGIYMLPEQMGYTINYSDGIKIENYILKSLKNAKDISDDSEELIKMAKDWPSYYHLGIGRSNILKALNLLANAKVLELGSGCGALTRYLGENFKLVNGIEGSPQRAQMAHERCRDLKNVKIFCSDFNRVKFNNNYDIVTLIGVLEYAPKYCLNQLDSIDACLMLLRQAKTALKKNGILLIAIENKIGIKYWSGCPEDHTGKIFDGIHGYPVGKSPITFSKKEIKTLLKEIGFSNIFFYYCFPDYKFASTIISDIGNETEFYLHNWIETPFASHNISRKYTFHEGLAIKTLSEAGLLREFANSFLIIASQNSSHITHEPDWIAKRFSVKRRKRFRCVTTLKIKPKFYVEKRRLFSGNEGYVFAKNTFLKIKHKVTDLPWYEGDLMTFDISKALFESDFENRILEMLNIYYQELINRFCTEVDDEDGFPILEGPLIDFIPRNIIRKNKKLICIDNEWWTKVPADFMMYRCITYDIIGLQSPWIRKNIKNTDRFTIELIKHFFPNYEKGRHNKNKMLEDSIQTLISMSPTILPQKFQCLRKGVVWAIIKKIWDKLPENIKDKIYKWIE